ncbi:MAG TPA: class I SAM-dependent methyltransferase [Solirubrobacterales bacterium]|nr:class I SAM-dependent methyltransferase [Solirubrobacterales bacterium]
MASTTRADGTAERWAELWGARPHGWAAIEEQQLPTYEEAIERIGVSPGQLVLDLGCGSGVFLRAAADRGARVFGFDAAESLLEIARARVPDADLRRGDLQFLPYEDDRFDLVTGFNSFFFAASMTASLREAGRVAKPGATVLIQVWGRPERCDLSAMLDAISKLRPERDAPASPPLSKPGVLEGIATEAGLSPRTAFDFSYAIEYPDEEVLADRMLSAGGVVEAVRESREDAVRSAIVESLTAYRLEDGSYRLENEWHYLVTTAR